MRRMLLQALLIIVILWTNPALNADGTPCTDLSLLRFRYLHRESGQVHTVDYPLWAYGEEGEIIWRSHEGLPDSANVALPRATHPYDWWWVTVFAVDFTGNVSDSSNTISVTAPE